MYFTIIIFNFIKLQYPESFVLEDTNLLRYLRGWGWNLPKVTKAVLSTLEWYREYKPHMIQATSVEKHFKSGKNYFNGFDKEGKPVRFNQNTIIKLRQVCYMRCSLDTAEDSEGKGKLLIYQMERAIRLMKKTGVTNGNNSNKTRSFSSIVFGGLSGIFMDNKC